MHRDTKKISGWSGMLVALAFAAMPASVNAAEEYHDSHCFQNSVNTVSMPDNRYASGEPMSTDEVAAIEELQLRHWRLRLSEQPGRAGEDDLREVLFNPGEGPRHGWWYGESVTNLEQLRQFNEQRSGAKIIAVSPAMKQLARARAEIRRLKQKPCSPYMVYLSTN